MKNIFKLVGGCLGLIVFAGAIALVVWGDDMQAALIESGDGHAEISSGSVTDAPEGERLNVTITFKSLPPGDTASMALVAESSAMTATAWTWAELAAADQDPATMPDTVPPLDRPLPFSLPIHLFPNVLIQEGYEPVVQLTLNWAGAKQHGHVVSLAHIYQ